MSSEEQTGAMSVAEAIRRKRAVRAYTPEPVPEEMIDAILNAGRRAQSAKNTQPWTFILVTEREQLARLATAGTYAAHMPSSAFTAVLVAPPGTEFDLGQAAANMQLAATALGVGSCVTTLHNQELAHEILGVPGRPELPLVDHVRLPRRGRPATQSWWAPPARRGGAPGALLIRRRKLEKPDGARCFLLAHAPSAQGDRPASCL